MNSAIYRISGYGGIQFLKPGYGGLWGALRPGDLKLAHRTKANWGYYCLDIGPGGGDQ